MATEAKLALVLSGGNALGAYQAGVYQALHEHGLEPDWVSGASAGAINAALICGNPADRRLAALQQLWQPAADAPAVPWPGMEEARRTIAASSVMTSGLPHLFVPRQLFGPWWNPLANAEPASLYDSTPMAATLERLVDFDRLNSGSPRLSVSAVDLENGEDLVFDTRTHRIGAEHLRASSALLPAFPPVEVDGRLLGDAGISANLPLDAVLGEPPERPLLCIAVDLLPLHGSRPRTLGDAICRMQDLLFATQSRRAIAAWQALYDERARRGAAGSVTLLHLVYADQADEVSGKAFDFSPETVATRWQRGLADADQALAQIRAGEVPTGREGLSVYRQISDQDGSKMLIEAKFDLAPRAG